MDMPDKFNLHAMSRAELAGLLAAIAAQLLETSEASPADRLLTVTEAAARLGSSRQWLYRHADELPFTVRLAPRKLGFSAQGIDTFLRTQQGA